VIALSGAAGRDGRVFVTQHVFTAYQHARGWAMAGDATEMDRALGRAVDLADTATARQAEAPDGMYWHGAGFFSMQRGLTWHTLHDSRYAARAAAEAQRAVAVCRATRSTQLAASLRKVHAQLREIWPTMPAVRELGDEVRTLVRAR
jgi:hypothetical protein